MESIRRVFSGAVDLSKVNPLGLVLMDIALLVVILARRLAKKLRPEREQSATNLIKLLGVLICAGGALLAING